MAAPGTLPTTHHKSVPSRPHQSCHFSWLTWTMMRRCPPQLPLCSHTHRAASVTFFNRLMSIIVGARRSPAQTVGLRIRVLVSWPSHTATSFPNARLLIRTGQHGARLARWCLAYVSCMRMRWRKDSIVCPALCSDSRPCMSLNHLLVSCCSVAVDYEGIIQCACFSRSMIAT